MGTRQDIMRHAGILPIELPSGSFIGAVLARHEYVGTLQCLQEPGEPDGDLADE